MGTPRASGSLRLRESSVTRSGGEETHYSGNVPLYQARMGGSIGRSSSRCVEGPGIGRWDCISAKGLRRWTERDGELWRIAAPIIYGPDARLSENRGTR